MSERRISDAASRRLWAKSGNMCAAPGCRQRLLIEGDSPDAISVGEQAHIYAFSPSGPRGRPWESVEDRNAVDNLILLCRIHHRIVDANPNAYPPDELLRWKQIHEEYVFRAAVSSKEMTDPRALSELSPLLTFDYRNPDDYHKWALLLSKGQFLEQFKTALRLRTQDVAFLFQTALTVADYLDCAGEYEEAKPLLEACIRMHPEVFLHTNISSQIAEREILHMSYGRVDARNQEVNFCKRAFGTSHELTLQSMVCRACALLESGALDTAEEVLTEAQDALSLCSPKPPDLIAYIDFQLGKLYTHRAQRSSQPDRSRFVKVAIALLQSAELTLEDLDTDRVTVYYVKFYLYKAYSLTKFTEEATAYRKESRAYFMGVRLPGFCHYDDVRIHRDLGL